MRKLLLSFVAMIIGTVSLFAQQNVVEITAADNLWASTAGAQNGTKGDVTISVTRGVLNKQYRAYAESTFSITATAANITSVEVHCAANYGPDRFSAAVGTYTSDAASNVGTWTGEAAKVDLVASAQVRMTKIIVTYVVDASAPKATALELTEAAPVETVCYVGDKFGVENLNVNATFSDNSKKDVTNAVAWTLEPAVIAQDTKSVTVTAAYMGVTASKTYDVTVKSIANTMETAYTVEEAVALIDAGKGLNTTVFVKGIVSKVGKFNAQYGSLTYDISTDGTLTSQQFQCYSGLNIGGTKFTAATDLAEGTKVIVKGKMKKLNNLYEFNYNNEIVSSETVGVEDIIVDAAQKDGKVVEDGKVVVLKAGKKFLVNGQRIK